MPVAFALLAMSFLGVWLTRGNINVASNALGIAASGAVRSFEFGVVPLFVTMGLVLDRADVGRDAFQVAVVLLRRVRGGLGIATVGANAIFAAITGSSIASAAVFSRIAVPAMTEAGYTRRFSAGVVAGSSVLGMLIPPSLLLIIYGLLAEVSIGLLFVAAIVPGIIARRRLRHAQRLPGDLREGLRRHAVRRRGRRRCRRAPWHGACCRSSSSSRW